ncbi:nitronate monooxygenase [Clostridia bacterium OttesenSCG-928-O13]|nr:nitronate monooxygenase [Clostridia bacterium OttesenSCG-928-O13]
MLKTILCELLSIRCPILQGGMAWISDAGLAAAVSNGGGLGIISATNVDAAWVRGEIRRCKKATQNPFGVNIMLMSPFADEVARMVVEEEVPVVTTGAGNPGKYLDAWHAAGIKVLPVVASVGLARLMARSGVAALIAEGSESGGHIGETSTMALIPQVCDAVDIPVVAAGGIADGRGLAAAMMLGAVGAQMGTRFLVASECGVHEVYKEKVLAARDTGTITTGKRLGHPVRSLKNAFSRGYFKKEYDGAIADEELEALGSGALVRAAIEGDARGGCFLAGQISGLVTKRQNAAEIVREVCDEAEALLKGANV